MNTKLEISRGPHGLRLYLPSGRTLDISASEAGARFIERILRDSDDYNERFQKNGYIGAFPTQAIVNLWNDREAIEEQAKKIKAEKAERAREERKEEWASKGIDIEKVEFKI